MMMMMCTHLYIYITIYSIYIKLRNTKIKLLKILFSIHIHRLRVAHIAGKDTT